MPKEQKDNNLDNAIKAARKSKGLTQIQLAGLLKITPRYLKSIENSGKKPSYDLLAEIIEELDIPPENIFRPASTEIQTKDRKERSQ